MNDKEKEELKMLRELVGVRDDVQACAHDAHHWLYMMEKVDDHRNMHHLLKTSLEIFEWQQQNKLDDSYKTESHIKNLKKLLKRIDESDRKNNCNL
jgi:hypothetical protein